ncbi:MAG: V-type ATPase subunit [Desulfobacteraceae bacterium]
MISRVFKYSFVQAWARTMKGSLLTAEDWHFLQNMLTQADFLRYLSGTVYGDLLEPLAGAEMSEAAFSLALYDHFFTQTARLLRTLPKDGKRLLASLLLRYDAENLKAILRGIRRGVSPAQITPLLYPLGALSQLPVESLLQADRISTALDMLSATVFHGPLMQALPQSNVQQRLFPLEIAIDHTAFEHLRADVKALSGFDRRKARDLIGALVDATNLSWLVRFRHVYAISAEECINYLLAGGAHLTIRDLGRLARAPDLRTFRESVPASLKATFVEVVNWEQIQWVVGHWFVDKLHSVFTSDPFQIGLPLSYHLLKEIEVKFLECHFYSLALGEPSDASDVPVRKPG